MPRGIGEMEIFSLDLILSEYFDRTVIAERDFPNLAIDTADITNNNWLFCSILTEWKLMCLRV